MTRSHLERMLAETSPALLGFFLRRTEQPEDAADLLSETLGAAWRSATRIPSEEEAARMWLFGVARNVLRHHVRSSQRRDALVARVAQTVRETNTNLDEAALDVRTVVAALPADLGELVRLIHWDGFTTEQVATLLDIPASTARSRHAKARQILRSALAEVQQPTSNSATSRS